MPIADMPHTPPLDTPVIIAQAPAAATAPATINRSIRVCRALSNMPGGNNVTSLNTLTPADDVVNYFYVLEKTAVAGPAKVTVLKPPAHGTLEDVGTVAFNETWHYVRDTGVESYNYLPDAGYLGADSATLLVSIGNYKVTTQYEFHVSQTLSSAGVQQLCPKPYAKLSGLGGVAPPSRFALASLAE